MAQIAQQDNLLIVADVAVANLDADIKGKLLKCLKAGTLTDVILQTKESETNINFSRVVSYYEDITNAEAVKYGCVVLVSDFQSSAVPTVIALN